MSFHHHFTKEQLAAGWRFGIWQNYQPNGQQPGGYVRKDGKVLRFETAEVAYHMLKSLGFKDHVGSDGWTREWPTAYVCPVGPEVRDEIVAPTGLKVVPAAAPAREPEPAPAPFSLTAPPAPIRRKVRS
jgi:hypothetical protein